jgi:peptidoglycan/LPS O-acetylase OafA/YrhL
MNGVLFAAGGATLIAGVGIHKSRRWALALAAILGALAITEAVAGSAIDPWEYHNFTIALPMAAIMMWALLPPTWQLFSQRSSKIS